VRPPDKNIDQALEYLYRNMDRPMSCEEIANICGCDPKNIKKIFYSAMAKLCDSDLDEIKKIWDEMKEDEH